MEITLRSSPGVTCKASSQQMFCLRYLTFQVLGLHRGLLWCNTACSFGLFGFVVILTRSRSINQKSRPTKIWVFSGPRVEVYAEQPSDPKTTGYLLYLYVRVIHKQPKVDRNSTGSLSRRGFGTLCFPDSIASTGCSKKLSSM